MEYRQSTTALPHQTLLYPDITHDHAEQEIER